MRDKYEKTDFFNTVLSYDAECYAKEHGLTFISMGQAPTEKPTEKPEVIVVGDVDGDKKVSVMDATAIQMHLAQIIVQSDKNLKGADADRDGKVSVLDATQIQFFLAQIIPVL